MGLGTFLRGVIAAALVISIEPYIREYISIQNENVYAVSVAVVILVVTTCIWYIGHDW